MQQKTKGQKMGDRVSISFVNDVDYINDKVREESVPLFNHWGGKEFPQYALNWVRKLKREVNEKKKIYQLHTQG